MLKMLRIYTHASYIVYYVASGSKVIMHVKYHCAYCSKDLKIDPGHKTKSEINNKVN